MGSVGLVLALALINTNSTNATPRESKMEQKCWNKKDAQDVPAYDNCDHFVIISLYAYNK